MKKQQPKTKAQQVRALLAKGKTVAQVISSLRKKGITIYHSEVYSAQKAASN